VQAPIFFAKIAFAKNSFLLSSLPPAEGGKVRAKGDRTNIWQKGEAAEFGRGLGELLGPRRSWQAVPSWLVSSADVGGWTLLS